MPKYRCRARTDDGYGALCRNPVKQPGQRCHHHKGQAEAPARLHRPHRAIGATNASGARKRSPDHRRTTQRSHTAGLERRPRSPQVTTRSTRKTEPATRRATSESTRADEERRKKRVEEARDFCADILTDGWQDAVGAKVAAYVTDETLERLAKRHGNACRSLATYAKGLLDGKDKLHDVVGSIARWIIAFLTGNRLVQLIARKLATKIPLPWDAQVVAVARGMQMIGILVCLNDGRNLIHCQCFVDLAIDETKERVKQIVAGALHDWRDLAAFPAPPARPSGPSRSAR